jgi:hypothetical protein
MTEGHRLISVNVLMSSCLFAIEERNVYQGWAKQPVVINPCISFCVIIVRWKLCTSKPSPEHERWDSITDLLSRACGGILLINAQAISLVACGIGAWLQRNPRCQTSHYSPPPPTCVYLPSTTSHCQRQSQKAALIAIQWSAKEGLASVKRMWPTLAFGGVVTRATVCRDSENKPRCLWAASLRARLNPRSPAVLIWAPQGLGRPEAEQPGKIAASTPRRARQQREMSSGDDSKRQGAELRTSRCLHAYGALQDVCTCVYVRHSANK